MHKELIYLVLFGDGVISPEEKNYGILHHALHAMNG
jgi:hypothetical protein